MRSDLYCDCTTHQPTPADPAAIVSVVSMHLHSRHETCRVLSAAAAV